jgi:hypothetical protein
VADLTRSSWLTGLTLTVLLSTSAAAQSQDASAIDCSKWTLDGYRLGMRGDEILAVRSVTLHVQHQAQAIEPGKFQGVLVLDLFNRLQKWDVHYDAAKGEKVRAELGARLGDPISEVSGELPGDETKPVRQRRTIWWSTPCDAAIVLYENEAVSATPGRSVSATLARTSMLPAGLAQMKTLLH